MPENESESEQLIKVQRSPMSIKYNISSYPACVIKNLQQQEAHDRDREALLYFGYFIIKNKTKDLAMLNSDIICNIAICLLPRRMLKFKS